MGAALVMLLSPGHFTASPMVNTDGTFILRVTLKAAVVNLLLVVTGTHLALTRARKTPVKKSEKLVKLETSTVQEVSALLTTLTNLSNSTESATFSADPLLSTSMKMVVQLVVQVLVLLAPQSSGLMNGQ